ncbi:MAG: lipid-A-disaccharide synthase, partial [Phycisphaerales bacterium]
GPALLFTAFEPSGDDHAAPVIAALRSRHPRLPIYAWGGPKMEAAGATIVERTGDDAVMGMPGLAKVLEHSRINRRIDDWLDDHRITVHVPVDSPAANFPICALTKARGAKAVHLVAPQIWAWGQWRLKKLKRLTDLVLCLLPFEEEWFQARGVPARFIGHPLFDRTPDVAAADARIAAGGGTFPS